MRRTPILALASAVAIFLLVLPLGPPLLRAAIPLLDVFPPGPIHQFATGLVTTLALQAVSGPVGYLLGRFGAGEPRAAMLGVVLAAAVFFGWELGEIGAGMVISVGPEMLLGRAVGLLAAVAAATGACGFGSALASRRPALAKNGEWISS